MSFITIPITIEGASFRNTAAGYLSLVNNTPGAFPNGEDNTGFGYLSLNQNTIGEGNSAFGSRSLALNTSGRFNVAIGERASYDNTTGQFNVAVGSTALPTSTNSNYNTAVGYGACGVLAGNVGSNTMVGAGAGALVTTGAKHTILGRYNGNQGGLDIRNLSNYIVLSDGDGNPRLWIDNAGLVNAPGGFAGIGGGVTLNNRTGAYTVIASDAGKAINCTANTFTVSLTAAATLGSGFACFIWNTGTGVITINPNGAETIDGVATLTLRQGEGTQIVCDGSNWITGSGKESRGYEENISATSIRPIASGSNAIALQPNSSASGLGSLAIGDASSASSSYSIAIGTTTTSSASYSTAVGSLSQATALNSSAFGYNCRATEFMSYATGTSSASATTGKKTYASGNFSTPGDAQNGEYCLRGRTTNATPLVLTTDQNATPTAINQVNIPNYSAYTFSGIVVARRNSFGGGTESAAWSFNGLIRREANAASTTLVASTVSVISNAPGWGLAISADTTNGALAVTATGPAGQNVRWYVNVSTAELFYQA